MPKFSIIIPVYNSERFLKKCLDSVLNQEYKNYEIIIINDGTEDDSYSIIESVCKDNTNVKYFDYGENKGLSFARNYGVSKASGEYILFLDSDDYYSENFLDILNRNLNDCDVVRFQCRDIFDCGKIVNYDEQSFKKTDGIRAFNIISGFHYVEVACLYCFKKSFWVENCFKFLENTYHEDFGLIPIVLISARSICSLPFIAYNYVQRSGSIMNTNVYEKNKKKCYDFLKHFKNLKEFTLNSSGDFSIYNSFIANSVILKSTYLKGKDYKNYKKELVKLNAFDMLLDDSFGRKIKKILIRFSPKFYYMMVRR